MGSDVLFVDGPSRHGVQVGGVGSSGGSGDGTVMADVLAGLGCRMREGAVGRRAGWGGG